VSTAPDRGAVVPIDRSRLPKADATPAFRFPAIHKSRLSNGLDVWTVEHRAIPVVALLVLVKRGAASDPPGREGLAAMTLDMLDEGSGDRSAIQMHEALAAIGAQLESDIGPDASLIGTTVLSRFAAPAVDLLGDLIVRPSLRDDDFMRVRQLRLHRLMQLRDLPSAMAERAFARLLYATHPYGHTPLGSEASLAALRADDVRGFHGAELAPAVTTLIAAGDCSHAEMVRQAERAFGDWQTKGFGPDGNAADLLSARGPGANDLALPIPARLNVLERPGAPQSELRIGHVAVSRRTPDYYALLAVNTVLGGQFVSRVNLNLREDKGFTYGARTAFDFRKEAGPFVLQVSVHTAATAAAIRESLAEIEAIRGARPVGADELAVGVAALTRGYARNFETADQVARATAQLVLYDLADDYFTEFVPAVERITPEEVTQAAERHLRPQDLTTLIVGDLEAIRPSLGQLGLGEPNVLPSAVV